MKSSGKCRECAADKVTAPRKAWTRIGESVLLETAVGRGIDRTDYAFFQCRICGSIWTQYEDSGAGGHGTFFRRLTNF